MALIGLQKLKEFPSGVTCCDQTQLWSFYHPQGLRRKKIPRQVRWGMVSRLPRCSDLRYATLLLRTLFVITLAGVVALRWVLLGRVLLVRTLSALVGRMFFRLVHRSSGPGLLLLEIFFSFVSHE